jgi:hypothetical protein
MTEEQKKLKAARDKRYNEKKKLQKALEKASSSMATGANSTPKQATVPLPECTPKSSELMQLMEGQDKYRNEMLGTPVFDTNTRCLDHEDFVRMAKRRNY